MNLQENVEWCDLLEANGLFHVRFNRLIYGQTDGLALEFTVSMVVEVDEVLSLPLRVHIDEYLASLLVLLGLVHDARGQVDIVAKDGELLPTATGPDNS